MVRRYNNLLEDESTPKVASRTALRDWSHYGLRIVGQRRGRGRRANPCLAGSAVGVDGRAPALEPREDGGRGATARHHRKRARQPGRVS